MSTIDYKSMSGGGSAANSQPNRQWWKLSKAEIPAAVETIVDFLNSHQTYRQTQTAISSRLYGNQSALGASGLSYSRSTVAIGALKDRISYNVCQSAVDTITSKIAKNKPKPFFLTSGGNYKMQRKAKKLGKFIDGCFYENEMHRLGVEVFRDAVVWGTGVVHVFPCAGRVKAERVLASELLVDEVEGFYGRPRQMHRTKNVDRTVLLELFPEHARKIREANRAEASSRASEDVSDQIKVIESWHLPSGPDAKDGLHTITISQHTLLSEDYSKDFFPFAFIHWSKRLHGFWGQGGVEQIQNIQLEINKLLWVIQRSMHLAGSFKILLENGSKIVKEHLNNDIGTIVAYTGTAPTYVTPPIVPAEIYQHLVTLKNAAFEQFGISQLSAESKKPAGLNSGKALREFNDIESDRFMVVGQQYERLFLDTTRLMVECAKDIYEDDKSFSVKVPGKKFIETIDWKDVDMEEDEYVMQIFPVSSLPSDPAGRLQTIQEYAQAGFLNPRESRRLLDFPDLEQIENLANSQEDYIHKILEKIVEEGEYTAPEPYDNLDLCQELALQYYSDGKQNDLEPEKMDLFRTFIDQVNLLKEKALQPPPMPPGAEMAPGAGPQQQPQAVPQAPQQSDLITNNPALRAVQ